MTLINSPHFSAIKRRKKLFCTCEHTPESEYTFFFLLDMWKLCNLLIFFCDVPTNENLNFYNFPLLCEKHLENYSERVALNETTSVEHINAFPSENFCVMVLSNEGHRATKTWRSAPAANFHIFRALNTMEACIEKRERRTPKRASCH